MTLNDIRPNGALAVFAALALLGGCERPTSDRSVLKAIKAESEALMRAHPTEARIPLSLWPPAIASLQPFSVTVDQTGVVITKTPGMDGGWGYGVPRTGKKDDLPMLPDCWSDLGHGVFWHGPC